MATKELTRQREIEAWRLRLDGKSQDEIAESLGVTQGAVSKILSRLDTRARAELDADINTLRREQGLAFDTIEAEALGAFEASKGNARTPSGDPRFLNTAIMARQARGRLFGLDSPREYSLKEPDPKPVIDVEAQRAWLADPELRRLSLERSRRELELRKLAEQGRRRDCWAEASGVGRRGLKIDCNPSEALVCSSGRPTPFASLRPKGSAKTLWRSVWD